MKTNKEMGFKARGNSFKYAFNGIYLLFKEEPNARIHFAATIAVIVAGILKRLPPQQWALITIAIAMVWVTEALNTAIEDLCDLYTNGTYHPKVKVIKDVAAGAVLVASIASVAIAVAVFFF